MLKKVMSFEASVPLQEELVRWVLPSKEVIEREGRKRGSEKGKGRRHKQETRGDSWSTLRWQTVWQHVVEVETCAVALNVT